MNPIEVAVDEIILDLSDRRGLRQEWDQISQEIKWQIRAEWIRIVKEALKNRLV